MSSSRTSVVFLLICQVIFPLYSGQLTRQTKQLILDLHNDARSNVGAPNMRKMGWSEELAGIAQSVARTCSRDPTPVGQLVAALDSQYSWIAENRRMVVNNSNYETALRSAFRCWDDGSGCTASDVRFREIAYPDSYLLGCGAHYFPASPICRNLGSGIHIICYYAPGAPASYPTTTGDACSQCPEEASGCDDGLCVPSDGSLPSVPADNEEQVTEASPIVYSVSPAYSSYGGGTLITITGRDFADDQFSLADDPNVGNRVVLYTDEVRLPCVVERYYTTSSRILCRTSPSPTQEQTAYKLEVTINGKELSEYAGGKYCSSGTCYVTYIESRTPRLSGVSPHAKVPGQDPESVALYGKIYSYLVADTQEPNEDDEDRNLQVVDRLILGGELCDPYIMDNNDTNDTSSIYGGSVDTNGQGSISCRSDTVRIDSMNASIVLKDYGTSAINMADYALDNKLRKYMFQTHPDIISVEPKTGSPAGGTMITIRGMHFTDPLDDIKVDISGVPCSIVSHNSTVIQCITGPAPPKSDVYPGGRGIVREVWKNIFNFDPTVIKARPYGYPNTSYDWTVQERFYRDSSYEPEFGEAVNFQQRYTGFFVPPMTATYTFNLYSDDLMDVYLSSDASRENMKLIAYTNQWTRYSWNYFATQLSEPINLVGGQAYYLETLQTQGTGPWNIGLGAKIHNITWTDDYAVADHEQQYIYVSSAANREKQDLSVRVNPKIQRITIHLDSNSSAQFTLTYKGVDTPMMSELSTATVIEDALNGLSTVTAFGGVELAMEKTNEYIKLTIYFVSIDTDLGNITASSNTNTVLENIQSYQSTLFTITLGTRTTGSLNETSTAVEVENELHNIISTKCSTPNVDNLHFYDDYEERSVVNSGTQDNFEAAYCGRFSVRNPRWLYRNLPAYTVNILSNRYACFYVKGEIPLSRVRIRVQYNVNYYRWRDITNVQTTFSNDDWQNICVDIWDFIDTRSDKGDNLVSFKVNGILLYSVQNDDFWVDEFRIVSSKVTVDQEVMATRPNNLPIDSFRVEKDEDLELVCSDDDALTGCQLAVATFEVVFLVDNCIVGLPLVTTSSDHVTVTQSRAASPPVGGVFDVMFEGNVVSGISATAVVSEVKEALEASFGSIFDVSRFGTCFGYDWRIRWENRGGDLPLVEVNGSRLTGDNPSIRVQHSVDGGVWIRPFRGDMLRLPELNPQVQVMVNGIPASCRSRDCDFTFPEDDVATIISISPSEGGQDGSAITISGTGFTNDPASITVSIGDGECTIQSATDSQIVCVPPQNVAGIYPVKVLVSGSGFAIPAVDGGNVTFEYSIVVDSIESGVGSVFGGNYITLYGVGFPSLNESMISDYSMNLYKRFFHPRIYVLFDDLPCFIKSSNFTTLTCVPQPHREAVVNVTIVVNGVELELFEAYEYSTNYTAVINSVTPSEGAVGGGNTINITGENFNNDVFVEIDDDICNIEYVSSSLITCRTPPHEPGEFQVAVTSSQFGKAIPSSFSNNDFTALQIPFAAFSEDENMTNTTNTSSLSFQFPTFTYVLVVNSMTPSFGSLLGGTKISIKGKGFYSTPEVKVTSGQNCEVTSFDSEEINCTMPSTAETPTIRNSGRHPQLGQYFAWEPAMLEITQGTTVNWEWTASMLAIPTYFEVHQTSSLTSSDVIGFRSESSIDGSFSYVFTQPGTYYYSSDVHSIHFVSGTIIVKPLEDIVTEVEVSVQGFSALYYISSLYSMESDVSDENATDCLTWEDVVSNREYTDPPVYVYSPCYTPIVRDINSGDSILTSDFEIIGELFGTEEDSVEVSFGDLNCLISSITDDSITCKLDEDARPQSYMMFPLQLHVDNYGYALLLGNSSMDRSITLYPSVINIEPAFGSVYGGNMVTISGQSFSSENTRVSFGDTNCPIINVTYNTITCRVPATLTQDWVNTTVNVSVWNNLFNRTAVQQQGTIQYSYTTDYTPIIMLISPATVVGNESTVITLTGELLEGDSVVMVGRNNLCTNVMEVEESITCSLGPIPAASYSLSVLVPQYGYASVTDEITSQLQLNSINPNNGGIRGGTTITLNGAGFSDNLADNRVLIGDQECRITEATYSNVNCITPDIGSNGTLGVSLTVTISDTDRLAVNKRIASGQQIGGLQFGFSLELTPMIMSITPSEGQEGDSVTISGSSFLIDDGSMPELMVTIGSTPCTVTFFNSSTIRCTLGQNFVGTYSVAVVNSDLGLADGEVNFTYILRVNGIDTMEGSFAGQNLLTIDGVGFSPTATFVSICDKMCQPSALPPSLTSLTCIVPSFADELNDTKTCQVTVRSLSNNITLSDTYTFKRTLTPMVNTINDTRGGTAGGTVITLTGSDFDVSANVTIDGIPCEVIEQSAVEITCRTGSIGRTVVADVMVYISGKGYAIVDTENVYFYYVDLWSSIFTWGGTTLPIEGDFVIVGEGQTLVLDTVTPILKILLIQGGELIFDDVPSDDGIKLQSELILITDGGRLQIGTKDNPYMNKAEIVMYGNVLSTELPLFGAKTLAVRNGTVDFHGRPIENTWTKLSATVEPGDTELHLLHNVSDWVVGGKIVIASTSYSQRENEELTIQSIENDGMTLRVVEPLAYRHIFFEQTIEGRFLQTSAEVGLLTRNIVFRGNRNEEWDIEYEACEAEFDPGQFALQTCFNGRFGAETVGDQFGGQLMLHRGPRDKVIGRIEYTEFTHVGQAFRLGRYPIHFHLNGDVSESYVRGNGIHNTFNRAVTIHAVDNLLVEKNVAYNILGHAYFLEDGIEQGTIVQYNLGVYVRASSSLLNVDITPATFWSVNPNNTFRGNAAAGGSHFGFWYRLPTNPTGPSFTTAVRPIDLPLQEFNNNTAHSFGWYGIWINPSYFPGGFPSSCVEPENPAVFSNFFGWRNNRGIEFTTVGPVQFINSTVMDNEVAGVEYTTVIGAWGKNGAVVENVLVVGRSALRDYDDKRVRGGRPVCSESGIKLPPSYYLTVSNVTFVNFNEPGCVAIRPCSHCRDFQGGYETRFEKLSFVDSPNVVAWQWEHEQVLRDLDGTLTGINGGSLLPWINALPTSNCEFHDGTVSTVRGAVCDSSVQFNRFALRNPTPDSLTFRELNVTNEHGTVSLMFVMKRIQHAPGYMAILPTNTEYTLEWSEGERFTNITYESFFNGMTSSDHFFIRHDFPRRIDIININGKTVNASVSKPDPANAVLGDWFSNPNDTSITYFASGADNCPRQYPVEFSTRACFYEDCIPPPPPEPATPIPDGRPNVTYMWSDPSIWPNGVVPTADNVSVTINKTFYVLVGENDVLPKFTRLTILGVLEFLDDVDHVLQADLILIDEGGRLVAGSEMEPFQHKLDIVLTGTIKALETYSYRLPNFGPVLGTKAIGVFGQLLLHGQVRMRTWTFLDSTAQAGSNELHLKSPVDWKAGEQIVIASTTYEANEAEVFTIQSISDDGLTLTLSDNLQYTHLGGLHNTDSCSVTVSAEVGLLSRNIRISSRLRDSDDTTAYDEDYGCRVLVSTYLSSPIQQWTGSAQLYGVEFDRCGQEGFVEFSDPRYALAFLNIGTIVDNTSYVSDCSIHDGYNVGIGVYGTNGMVLRNNVLHNTLGASIDIVGRNHQVVDNLAVLAQFPGTYKERNEPDNDEWTANYKLNEAENLVLTGNSAAGGAKSGFHTDGENCIEDGFVPQWKDNIAHSTLHGVHIPYSDGHVVNASYGCLALSNFHVHNCYSFGIFVYTPSAVRITDVTLVNNYAAMFSGVIGPRALSHVLGLKSVSVSNSVIVGSIHVGGSNPVDCKGYSAKPEIAFHKRSHAGIQSQSGGHVGVVLSLFSSGTGGFPKFPWQVAHNYPAIVGLTALNNVTFCKFGTYCDSRRDVALITHPDSEDAQHPVELMNTRLIDVASASKFFNHNPKIGSINPSDCVDMDCDAYKKILIRDLDGSFTETPGNNLVTLTSNSAFGWDVDVRRGLGDYRIPRTMVAEPDGGKIDPAVLYPNKGIYRGTSDQCEFNEDWNSYKCTGIDHMMMVIESLDADTEVRRLSPIGVGGNGYIDLINGPQDHGWCGGYTCQERISTFYTIIATGLEFDIGLTSTNPQDMRLLMVDGKATQKIKIGLFYNSPQRLDIYVDGQYVKPNNGYFDSDGNLRYSGNGANFEPELSETVGANYYDRTYKKLYFILQGDKEVTIMTSPVIQLGINLPPITVDDFFETNLIMNLALLLDIPPNRIRIVSVVSESSRKRQANSGSTRVEIEIATPPQNTTMVTTTTTVQNVTRNDTNGTYSPYPTQPPVTVDQEFEELAQTATRTAEVIQTGALSKAIGVEISGASLVPPEPEVVDPTGGVRATEGDGGPQPGDNGTATLETFAEKQEEAEKVKENETETVSLSIPTTLNSITFPSEGIEGIPLTQTIVIGMYDASGNIVVNLGYNSPWKLQATIVSGPDNSFLTNNTVDMTGGRAEFTDLTFSHPGTYRVMFNISLPVDSNFALAPTTDIVISKRDLYIMIDTQPPSEGNTTFLLYPYPSISIRDRGNSNSVVDDLGWRGEQWYTIATLMDTSTEQMYGDSFRIDVTNGGQAMFSNIKISHVGTYVIRFTVETESTNGRTTSSSALPESVDSNEITVVELPLTRITVVYNNSYDEVVGTDENSFKEEFIDYVQQTYPDITIYNVNITRGSIIVSFFATSSDADTLSTFTMSVTTTDFFDEFTFNDNELILGSSVQDLNYPIVFPTDAPKQSVQYLVVVIIAVALGSVILLALVALTFGLFCYYGSQKVSSKQKSFKAETPRDNDYEKFPMGTIYRNSPIFDDDDQYPAFHIVMDETNNMSLAKDESRPPSRTSDQKVDLTKEKEPVRYVSSKEIKVGDSSSVTVYDKPQMTQGDFEDNMSLDEVLKMPAMINGNTNNNNANSNSMASLPPVYAESYEFHPNAAFDSDISVPPAYRPRSTSSSPRPSSKEENFHGLKVTSYDL